MSTGTATHYVCACCGGTFRYVTDGTWSGEQAEAEFADNFKGLSFDEAEVVCDDCFQRLMGRKPS